MARTTKKYTGLGALASGVLSSCVLLAIPGMAAAEEPGASSGPPGETAPLPAAALVSPPPSSTSAFDPKINVGAWMRLGGRVENPTQVGRLNDGFMDTLYLVASIRGQFAPWLKWQASLGAQHYSPPGDVTLDAELVYPQVGLQDLIVKIEPTDLFNIWVGKMLLPLDRANLSGPWFINYWLLRGIFPRSGALVPAPYGIKSGPFGREQGVTVWGQVAGGRFKYYGGAYALDNASQNAHPMYAGRLVVNLLDPEPGYFNQSAYHGERDILSFGVGGQYQKGASVTVIPAANPELEVGDLKVVAVDALLDKKLGSHVITAEASAYFMDKFQPINRLYVVGLGYVSPSVGPGRLAPAVRAQLGTVPNVMSAENPTGREIGLDREFRQVDGYVQYLIKSHQAKIIVGGFWTETRLRSSGEASVAKGIQFGLQLIAL